MSFERCKIIHDGRILVFTYANSVSYEIPLLYLQRWAVHPNLVHEKGRWRDVREDEAPFADGSKVVGARRLELYRGSRLYDAINLFLDNGTGYIVPFDAILKICEPRYEHFGGFLSSSNRQRWVEAWREDYGQIKSFLGERVVNDENFGRVTKHAIIDQGERVLVQVACGERYVIPVSILKKCEGVITNQRTKSMNVSLGRNANRCAIRTTKRNYQQLIKTRLLSRGKILRLYFGDNSTLDVSCKTILENFEDRYEFFKGRK